MFLKRVYKKKINDFFKQCVYTYCMEKDILKTFESFLFHDKNDICSPAYYYLHLCPKIYLANSKTFGKYYKTLDSDFQKDIITKEEIRNTIVFLKQNTKLLDMLKEIQKEDSIL